MQTRRSVGLPLIAALVGAGLLGCDAETDEPLPLPVPPPAEPTCSLPTEDPVVVALEATDGVTQAIFSDGSLWCWGVDSAGGCGGGYVPFPVALVEGDCLVGVSSNAGTSAVAANGTLHLWDLNPSNFDLPDPYVSRVDTLGIVNEARNFGGSFATLDESGVARQVGRVGITWDNIKTFDDFEPIDLPSKITKLGSGEVPCVVAEDGKAYCLKVNSDGVPINQRLPDGINVTNDAAEPFEFKALGLPGDVLDITVGDTQACALLSSGAVYCAGESVGPDPEEPDPTFQLIPNLPALQRIKMALYGETMCGLSGSEVWCWGANYSELYQAEETALEPPVLVEPFDDVIDFAVSNNNLCVLRADHSVWCRGGGVGKGICGSDGGWDEVTFEYCDAYN